VKSKFVEKGAENFDIGCGDAFGGKAEDDEGVADECKEKFNDIIEAFKYKETSFSKNDYSKYIKSYMKRVKTYLEANNAERVPPFMKGA